MNLFAELQAVVSEDVAPVLKTNPVDTQKFMKSLGADVNDQLTQRSAVGLIDAAHEKAEQVETVLFGLELNDGAVVKVYVDATQADDFETAMADMLGQEDDVVKAINDLADKFDIVSVEWPEGSEQAASQEDHSIDSDAPAEVEAAGDEDNNAPKQSSIRLNFNLSKSAKDGEEDKEAADEKPKDDKEDDASKEGDTEEDKPEDDSEESDDLDLDAEDDTEEDATDDKADDSEEKPAKKKAKKKKAAPKKDDKVEEEFKQFFENYIVEKKIDDSESEEITVDTTIESLFKTSMQKKIYQLFLHFDIPEANLKFRKGALRYGVRQAAITIMSNSKARVYLDKVNAEFEALHGKKKVEEETISHSLAEKQADLILAIIKKLGLPDESLDYNRSAMQKAIRQVARLSITHSKLKSLLDTFAKSLEVETESTEEVVAEDVKLGSDYFLKLMSALLPLLGIPDENLNYKRVDLIKSIRAKNDVLNTPAVRTKIGQLIALINQEATNESLTILEAGQLLKQKAANLGGWNITQVAFSDSLVLANDDISIELNDKQTKKLIDALEDGLPVIVKSGKESFKFSPIHDGKEYIVLDLNGTTYPDGVILGSGSIKKLLNLY